MTLEGHLISVSHQYNGNTKVITKITEVEVLISIAWHIVSAPSTLGYYYPVPLYR